MPLDGAVFPLALVVVPTRELAVQIFKEAMKFAYRTPVKVTVIYGGVSVQHQSDILRRMGCHICVATPGRLDDFVKRGKVCRYTLNSRYLKLSLSPICVNPFG